MNDQWLAGFVDGEGYIGLLLHRSNTGFPFGIRPVVVITQKDRNILELIQNYLRMGRIHPCNKGKYKLFQLCFTDKKNCSSILNRLAPFLLLKKRQADIVAEFCRHPPKSDILDWRNLWEKELSLFVELNKITNRRKWGGVTVEEVRDAVNKRRNITTKDFIDARNKAHNKAELASMINLSFSTTSHLLSKIENEETRFLLDFMDLVPYP